MDFALFVRRRLKKLGLEQRDLAIAVQVTQSYVSQLLTGKKAPPTRQREDLYARMETFLKLSKGELSNLAALQRREQLARMLGGPPEPLFKEVRQLILLIIKLTRVCYMSIRHSEYQLIINIF